MASRYAERTTVPVERSRADIERLLYTKGATEFVYGWNQSQAVVMFTFSNRRIRFELPLPDRSERKFSHTLGGQLRSAQARDREFDQEVRRLWRSLLLMIKAKIETVASGVTSWEKEFGMYIVLPDGRTVGDVVLPQIEDSYRSGRMPPLLALPAGDS